MRRRKSRQQQLRAWHLARLRTRALEEAAGTSNWTPAGLIVADRDCLEQFIADRMQSKALCVPEPGKRGHKYWVILWACGLYLTQAATAICFLLNLPLAGYWCGGISCSITTLLLLGALQKDRQPGRTPRWFRLGTFLVKVNR